MANDINGNIRAPRILVYTYVDGEIFDLTKRVKAVDFEDHLKKIDQASIRLDNHDLGVFDDDKWATGSHIYLSYGFFGKMSIPVHLRIKKVTGGREAHIEAVNAAAFSLDLRKRSRTWEHVSYSDVVRDIALKNGITSPNVQDTTEIYETVTQANQTDGVFLRELADREGYDFRVVGTSIHWGERDLSPAPIREIAYYSTDKIPGSVIDFGIENDCTRRFGRVRSGRRDPINRQTVENLADNLSDKDRRVFTQWTLTPGDEDGLFKLDVEETEASTQSVVVGGSKKSAKGAFRASSRAAVKMWVSVEGDPDVHAGEVVEISGMGQRLSGKYLVKGVRHNLESRGRYTMALLLTTDGVNKNKGSNKGKSGLSLSEAIANLKRLWQKFKTEFRGGLETLLEGFTALIRQLDAEITGLSVSSFTTSVSAGISERLQVLQSYLYRFIQTAEESSSTENSVVRALELASDCYAAAQELNNAVISAGMEEQAGIPNTATVNEEVAKALVFDGESGESSLVNDPSVRVEKEVSGNEVVVTGGSIGGKPIPQDLQSKLAAQAEEMGLGID